VYGTVKTPTCIGLSYMGNTLIGTWPAVRPETRASRWERRTNRCRS